MNYSYDKDQIKESLTTEQVEEVLTEFGGEPERRGEILVSRTVCHCGNSHKLYYYPNTKLFKCYTDCAETFDIFELTRKVMSREQPKVREDSTWNLPEAIDYIAQKFGFAPNTQVDNTESLSSAKDLILFEEYDRINNINNITQEVELKEYPSDILLHLPHPKIQPWLNEDITQEVMDSHGICYDPKNEGIVIPHYDINNRLVGIRERTLIKENEIYGKYRPAYIGKQLYNHPLSFAIYNLNMSKDNIKKIKKAIIFESEKSCLKYSSFFGKENDISGAVCGCNLINYQFFLLLSLGVEEIIIGFDRQYKKIGDEEYLNWIKKLTNIAKKYSKYCNITFIFDTKNLLDYKDAPVDKGPEVFKQLYKERLDKDGKPRS
jgi:hypothetical protein